MSPLMWMMWMYVVCTVGIFKICLSRRFSFLLQTQVEVFRAWRYHRQAGKQIIQIIRCSANSKCNLCIEVASFCDIYHVNLTIFTNYEWNGCLYLSKGRMKLFGANLRRQGKRQVQAEVEEKSRIQQKVAQDDKSEKIARLNKIVRENCTIERNSHSLGWKAANQNDFMRIYFCFSLWRQVADFWPLFFFSCMFDKNVAHILTHTCTNTIFVSEFLLLPGNHGFTLLGETTFQTSSLYNTQFTYHIKK